ncbi:hypothetical protein AXG93_2556s1200 [Marchantia polymorpha subsp. ruderalis]|uniref:Uncharacterized protein n=1 Tax=Marchantia polymorpha subsp. ruderalis TaxID=1480154 RepID=A0A176VE44_MARPO|nr:hypothetical protein AXG93_2556s1200 [Marchantia polymorpha subsp. ruderalis]
MLGVGVWNGNHKGHVVFALHTTYTVQLNSGRNIMSAKQDVATAMDPAKGSPQVSGTHVRRSTRSDSLQQKRNLDDDDDGKM